MLPVVIGNADMGIRGKLALLVPGVVALSLIGLSLAATGFVRREALEELRARHTQVLQAISVTAAVHVAEGDSGSLQRLIRELGHEGLGAEIEWVAVNDADGQAARRGGDQPRSEADPGVGHPGGAERAADLGARGQPPAHRRARSTPAPAGRRSRRSTRSTR